MIDIGTTIKQEMEKQERTVSWLARKLNVNRAAVYRILGKSSIDTYTLTQISKALNRNFLSMLAKELGSDMSENDTLV